VYTEAIIGGRVPPGDSAGRVHATIYKSAGPPPWSKWIGRPTVAGFGCDRLLNRLLCRAHPRHIPQPLGPVTHPAEIRPGNFSYGCFLSTNSLGRARFFRNL
jgi:hypothetical protein